jgi:hypothetical protein
MMFAHDVAYRLRVVRDAVRIGYSVDDGLSRAFGVFAYQRRGECWDAVNRCLASALALGDSDAVAGAVLGAVEDAYRDAVRAAAV